MKIRFAFDFRVKYVHIWTFLGSFVEIHSLSINEDTEINMATADSFSMMLLYAEGVS